MKMKRRYGLFFDTVIALLKPVARALFNFEYQPVEVDGPALVLCNHNMDEDCYFLACAINQRLSFVATENVSRLGILGWIVRRFFDPILHYKGTLGIATTKNILKKLKAGKCVAMFPEGNRSFNGVTCPIPPATARLAKASGASLVTYNIQGGYFSYPRWGSGIRKGRVRGQLAGIYTHEQMMAMTDEELQSRIEQDLYADAYAEQLRDPVSFRGKKRAEGLESTLFCCPDCGRVGTLVSKGDNIFCDCGFEAYYDELGWLVKPDGTKLTITELDLQQRKVIEKMCKDGAKSSGGELPEDSTDAAAAGERTVEPYFTDEVELSVIDAGHRLKKKSRVQFAAYKDCFLAGTLEIRFDSIAGIAINQRNLMMIHVKDFAGHYEFIGPKSFSSLKYLYLYRAVCGSGNGVL